MSAKRWHWNPPKMCKNGCPSPVYPGLTVCRACAPDTVQILEEVSAALAEKKSKETP